MIFCIEKYLTKFYLTMKLDLLISNMPSILSIYPNAILLTPESGNVTFCVKKFSESIIVITLEP